MKFRKTANKLISLSLTLNMVLAISAEPLESLNNRVSAEPLAHSNNRPQEPRAGTWRTYALTSGAEIPVPPPPHKFNHQTRAELDELRKLQAERTPEIQAVIDFWNAQPAFKPWTETHLDLIRSRGVNTPRAPGIGARPRRDLRRRHRDLALEVHLSSPAARSSGS